MHCKTGPNWSVKSLVKACFVLEKTICMIMDKREVGPQNNIKNACGF